MLHMLSFPRYKGMNFTQRTDVFAWFDICDMSSRWCYQMIKCPTPKTDVELSSPNTKEMSSMKFLVRWGLRTSHYGLTNMQRNCSSVLAKLKNAFLLTASMAHDLYIWIHLQSFIPNSEKNLTEKASWWYRRKFCSGIPPRCLCGHPSHGIGLQ